MANARDQEQDPSKRGLTGSYHQRTYGTVKEDFSHSLNPKRDAKVLMHEVKLTDTLQGIALKYDVAVDVIRRLNKLGYSESIQTRTVLELPLPQGQDNPEGMATAKPHPNGGGGGAGEEASKDYLERSPQSILDSADEELEQAKKFVAKLAKKQTSVVSATSVASTVSVHAPPSATPLDGYNRPTEESPRPDPKTRITRSLTDSDHEKRDKLESTMFEL